MFKAVKRDEPLEAKGVDMEELEEILPNEAEEPVKRKRRRRKRQAGYARPKKHYPEPTNDQIKDLSERQEKLMKKVYHTGGVAPGRDKVHRCVPQHHPDAGLTCRMVGKWLSNQETNQLHRYFKKQTGVAPVLSRAPNKAWVAGLFDPPGEKSA